MVVDAFQQRKALVLAGLQADCGDKSRKGSVDAPVAGLVARINAHPAVYTTSSCSGRITVFGEPTAEGRAVGKKGGEWVYASHDPADPHEVVSAIRSRADSGARLVLRFEPFILALEANSAAMGQRVLAAARAAGFRESGLTLGSGGRRVMVGVRCSLRLEVPVADAGAVLVPEAYLTYLVGFANDKFRQNLDRIHRFDEELFLALGDPVAGSTDAVRVGAGGATACRKVRQPAVDRQRLSAADPRARSSAAPPLPRPPAAGANGGGAESALAAAPLRCRRDGGRSGDGTLVSEAALKTLKTRQARVLGRIRALEVRILGMGQEPAGGGGGVSGGGGRIEPDGIRGAAVTAATAAAAAAAAGVKKLVAQHSTSGGPMAHRGALQWRPVVPVSLGQGGEDEAVPRWGHASAVHGDVIYLLGGYGGGGAHARRGDVLMYDARHRTWEALAVEGAAAPPPRMGHTAACVGDGYVVLVGGRTSPIDALADVWILDLKTRSWIQVQPSVDPATTAGTRCGYVSFPGRYRHSAVAVPPPAAAAASRSRRRSLEGWRVVVFGGRNGEAVLGDTWVLSRDPRVSDDTPLDSGWHWQQLAPAASPGADSPSPRKSHAACWVPAAATADAATAASTTLFPLPAASWGRMYMHGGTCGYGMHFNDTFYLDLDSYTWHRCEPRSSGDGGGSSGGDGDGCRGGGCGSSGGAVQPPACFSHTLSLWGSLLLLVGGYPTDHHRQLCVLDTRSHRWTALDVEVGTPVPVPAATAVAAAAAAAGAATASMAAGAAPLPPSLDFVPIRHCAEVVGDTLYVMGGGAFCFSFGTVFGGCFELLLGGGSGGGPLQVALRKASGEEAGTTQGDSEARRQPAPPPPLPPPAATAPSPAVKPPAPSSTPASASASATIANMARATAAAETITEIEIAAAQQQRHQQWHQQGDGAASEPPQPQAKRLQSRPKASVEASGGGSGGCDDDNGGEPYEAAVQGWVVSVRSQDAKVIKDALKAAGLLDASRRGVVEATAAAAKADGMEAAVPLPLLPPQSTPMTRRVLLPVTDDATAAAAAMGSAEGGGRESGGGAGPVSELAALLHRRGAQLLRISLPPATKNAVSPAQRLRNAVAALLRPATAMPATRAATITATATAGAPLLAAPLVSELLADLPSRWERLGDLALLPAGSLTHPGWEPALAAAAAAAAAGDVGFERGTRDVCGTRLQVAAEKATEEMPEVGMDTAADEDGKDAHTDSDSGSGRLLLPLWRVVASALGVQRLARQAPVANTGTRDSRAVLLLGSHGWVRHREGGVTFHLDVTRCMFSSGNVTERTRLGWGRGLYGSGGGGVDGGRPGWAAGETVVDLYCGIGYYTLPLLVVAGVAKVYACEWNPHALEALHRNLQQPPLPAAATAIAAAAVPSCGSSIPATAAAAAAAMAPVSSRCEVLEGDCRLTAPRGVADRVLLGLLPSSRGGWEVALRALKADNGGWLHLHHNVIDIEEAQWLYDTMDELRRLAAAAGRVWELRLHHVERVKWYAPHIRHIVMDIECRSICHHLPRPMTAGQPTTATSTGTEAEAACNPCHPLGGNRRTTADVVMAGPPRWYEQPYDTLPHVPRVGGVFTREIFERDISPRRQPVILKDLELGPAPRLWTPEYLMSLPAAKSTLVSVHVSREPNGCLDFVHKNFAFRTMTMEELVARIAGVPPLKNSAITGAASTTSMTTTAVTIGGGGSGAATATTAPAALSNVEAGHGGSDGGWYWPELVPACAQYGNGTEVLYLRSIGENPRRESANLAASFPALASDLALPPLFPPSSLHSSVLRISSPGLVLWTHYDVMDNLLIQVRGTKRVLLWPPNCHDLLHVSGSSSPVTRLSSPDLRAYPRFADCPAPLVADLAPGDVLFLPSLWFHNVTATGADMSVSVNVFWRHLPPECYHRKDLYGNRDLVQAEQADQAADQALAHLDALPPHYRDFYGARMLSRLHHELGL